LLAEVDRLGRHDDLDLCPSREHDDLRTARSTAISIAASTWPMMPTTASPIVISIRQPVLGAGREDDGNDDGGGEDAAITTGANAGAPAPISGRSTCGSFLRGDCRTTAGAG
jgi:hypothetical protein